MWNRTSRPPESRGSARQRGRAFLNHTRKKAGRSSRHAPRAGAAARSARGGLERRVHRHFLPILVLVLELHDAGDECEQRIVIGAPNILPGMKLRPALPHEDVPRDDLLAAVALDAEILGIAGPAVPAGAYALLVCHGSLSRA